MGDLNGKGMIWTRYFGTIHPYDEITWVKRDAQIVKGNGKVVFEQKDIEVPDSWSQTAIDIVASKYFRGRLGTPERETSVKQMVNRVADTISGWGKKGYFATEEDYENFRDDLKFLLVNQYAAFNSPVWFNVGVYDRPQCSACFILAVEDSMESILEWYRDEGWIFKYGSGSGTNLSKIRSSKEPLSRGGYSSGPVSFMKGADGVANSIRSGGTTRRAAKMVVLNSDHPDIKDFVYCKKNIEEMTHILEASGVKNSIEGEIFDPYTLLPYQNANNSVRVTDAFMKAVENDEDWELKAVVSGETVQKLKAREVMKWIVDAAWHSADPGLQYDTTINDWHTCPNTGRINASNPCSEYLHIDNSSCNLASINLLKFLEDGVFNVEKYKRAIQTMITAQEIIVSNAFYPTEKITKNSMDYRQLGLGYANLGSLLMNLGLPYDSDDGRVVAGALTAILCGEAYAQSARIASVTGPFAGYEMNKEAMLRVISKHTNAAESLAHEAKEDWIRTLTNAGVEAWYDATGLGQVHGFRNSQATVLAPTGTIAFLMDCNTTGVEPELALVKYKKLVGGGTLKLVNAQVPPVLRKFGYSKQEIIDISSYLMEKETIEGAPHIKPEHLPVFDCSFKATNGTRSISYQGHIKMMGAVQPFVSGAISKTVNLPTEATPEDIQNVFIESWKLGLKAVAVYRDGSKSVQPMSTKDTDKKLVEHANGYTRVKLPDERPAFTHKFTVGNHEGYLTVGMYPDTKQVAETFISMAKEGSTISGLLDVIATLTSLCLQSGVPLKFLVKKFKDYRFEPSGLTANEQIPFAKSFMDYVFRYMGMKFLPENEREEIFGPATHDIALPLETHEEAKEDASDAPLCECGTIMIRVGSCFSCPNCFATTGVCN